MYRLDEIQMYVIGKINKNDTHIICYAEINYSVFANVVKEIAEINITFHKFEKLYMYIHVQIILLLPFYT